MKKIERYKKYIETSFWYLGSSLLVALIGIAINPLMAKNLSSEDYAIIGYFTSFNLLILPLLHLNLMTYYLRNFYRVSPLKQRLMGDTILISMMVIGLVVLTILLFCFYFFCKYTQVKFQFFPYAIYTFAQVYFSMFFSYYLIKLRVERKAKKFATISIINCVISVSLAILLVVIYKYGVDGRLLAALLVSIIFAIYSFWKSIGKLQIDFIILKDALKFGWPLTISALLWYFLSGIDRIFLAELNDMHTYGIYCVAIQITAYLTIFYTTVNNTFEPDIFKAIAENKTSRLVKLVLGILSVVIVANLVFIIFATSVIGLLTANRYIDSATFAQILALHNITMAMYYLVVKLIIGYGYVKAELVVRIVGAVLSVMMFRVLIDKYGFYGAAWGQVLSFLLLTIIGLITLFTLNNKIVNFKKNE